MPEQDKTPSWKSFLYALAGAGGVYSACMISLREDTFGIVLMGVWGVTFWVGGIGNLFVDRRLQREAARRESKQ